MPYWGSNAIALLPTHFQNHQPLHQDSEFHARLLTSQPSTFKQLTFKQLTFNLSTFNLQPANLQPSTSQPSTS
ncbi:hypothetical protein BJP34_17755 [Moorena producens PAL-8-15-08-1]|uniref:Uncharacterized protein n=1 Tax=Moorena producens PAL-8-15-08-1 TaxID=1458985 RepID=A0A1D8TTR9_9CYAN|nr:hypothetical protein [Moorena producens]AOX01039.1 hypothetical protein BJP34_17755 [Moorena producens PAL-8-15-08-1]